MTSPSPASDSALQPDEIELGELPVWNLGDLYPGRDSAELRSDLERARVEAKAVEAEYKGKLEALAKAGGLGAAIKRMEVLTDLTGRIGSYAYLQYVQNTQDADSAKFLGADRPVEPAHLLHARAEPDR
jgi:oligoendopeptidase F